MEDRPRHKAMPPSLKLELPDAASVALRGDCIVPSGGEAPAVDARQATAEAMAHPIGFPAFADAVVPGDRVAIALGEGIPDVVEVAAGLMDAMATAGVETSRVSIVTAQDADATLLEEGRGTLLPADVGIVRHDPADENELCWSGVMREDDEPVTINRVLFEADLTLPVVCVRPQGDRDHRGAYGGLYPAFSSEACIKKFRRTAAERHAWWQSRTDEAAWVIGVPLTVQVAPGRRDAVSAVFAGTAAEALAQAEQVASQAWQRTVADEAQLVIATLSADPVRQSWDDLARALAAADRLAAPGAAVALCTSLRCKVGRSLGRLRGAADLDAVVRKLEKDDAQDTWAARQVIDALQRGPLFLVSQLDDDVVEDLGMAPIQSPEQLPRLAERFQTVALLEDANRVSFTAHDVDQLDSAS